MSSFSKMFSLDSYPWVKEKLQGGTTRVISDMFRPCGTNRVMSGNVDQEHSGLKDQGACSHQFVVDPSDDLTIRLSSLLTNNSKNHNRKFHSHLVKEGIEQNSFSDVSDYSGNISTLTMSNKSNLKCSHYSTLRFPESIARQLTSNLSRPLNFFNGKKMCSHTTPIDILDEESFETTLGMHIVPHTLYNILAISSPTCLCLVTQPHLNLLEIIFHSTTSKTDDFDNLPSFPVHLNDALFYTCTKESLSKKKKEEFSDRLLSLSWHRESLTLAVGTFHAIYIIKPSIQMEQSLCSFNKVTRGFSNYEEMDPSYSMKVKSPLFVLAFSVKLDFPCYTINWIHDDLLTKGTNGYTACHDASLTKSFDKISQDKTKSVMNTQFFVWRCKFQRGGSQLINNSINPLTQSLEKSCEPLFETQDFFEGDSLLKPFVAKYWKFNEPLASFISCESTPSLSWRCVIGSNTKLLSPLPLFQPTYNEVANSKDSIYSGIFRLVAHPAGRFLAVLYTLGTNFTDKSSQLCVTSPIVRIWCLHTSKRKRVGSFLNEKSLAKQHSKVSMKSFLNFTTCFGLKHIFRQNPCSKKKNYRKKNSCGFRLPRFHFRRHYFHLLKKQRHPIDSSQTDGKVISENANLQGPELSILRQLTSVKDSHKLAHTLLRKRDSASGFKRRISLLKFIATQRLASDEELRALCRMTMPDNSTERKLLAQQSLRCQSLIEESDYIKNSILVKEAQNLSLQKASGIFEDGPYVSLTLLHRAPVVDLVWKDTGPVSDVIFVPAVICSLTADNCLTIWLESSLQMPLQFDPVVVLRLRFNPLKKLIPLVNMCHSSTFSQSTNKEDLCMPASTLITKSGLTLCWLTAHHVSLETYQIDNILRFCRVQAFAENTDFNVYEAVDVGMYDAKLSVEQMFQNEVVRSKASSQPISSFSEKTFEEYYRQKYFSTGLSLGPNGHLDAPSFVELSKEIAKKQPTFQKTSQELFNTKTVPPMNLALSSLSSSSIPTQMIDFVLVAESCSSAYFSSEKVNGLWVYAFRDLSRNTLSTADATVKELLSPRHIRIPCRISNLVSAKCIPSLGLQSCLWGDTKVSGLWGEPITVQDGILFPASYVTIVTCSAEIWTCAIKPYIVSYQLSSGSLQVQYQVTVISIYGQCVSISRIHPKLSPLLPCGRFGSQTPTQTCLKTASSTDSFPDCLDQRCLSNVFWKLIEEHRFNSFCLLALDSDGKLFFGETSLTKRSASIYNTEEAVWRRNSTYCFSSEKSFLSPIDTNKFSTHVFQSNILECLQPDSSSSFSSSFSESNNSTVPDNVLECGYSMKALVSLDSLATNWLEDNLVCQLQRTPEDSTPSSSFIPFPELDYAAWLPIMGEPSIMLGVTRVERYVLAIQILPKFLREKPFFTVLPFHGSLEPCFDAVQAVKSHLVSSPTCLNEKQDTTISVKKTSIVSLQMFAQSHQTCLIFVRIRETDFVYEKNDTFQNDTLLLMRCFKGVYKSNYSDAKSSLMEHRPCLIVNTVFKRTIVELHECIWKSLYAFGVTIHETDSYLLKNDTPPEPICCCSPCCFTSTSNSKGLLAMFFAKKTQELHRTIELCDGILLSVFQFEESQIKPLGFTHVSQKYFQRATYETVALDNMIVSIALQEETLCILTSIGFVLLFELCDLFLNPGTPESVLSLWEKFCETNPHNTVYKTEAFEKYLMLPVAYPSTVIDLRYELTKNFDMMHSKTTNDKNDCFNLTTLPVEVLGDAPYLTFQCTKGNGLLLLVTLKLFLENQTKSHNVSINYHCVPFIYARRIGINNNEWIECHLSNLHQLHEGLSNPLQAEQKDKKCCLFRHVSWGAGSSELLLGRTCEEDECWTVQALRPPITLKLPETLLKQASVISSPRPVYHPHVLNAHIRLAGCPCMLKCVLKQLFVNITRWRQHKGESHMSDTLDFSVEFLKNMFVELEPTTLTKTERSFKNSSVENSFTDSFDIHSCLHDESYLNVEELKLLINYADIKNSDNRWYLQCFGVLVPHLTLLETVQLYGILQFLLFVFQVKNNEELTLSTSRCLKKNIFALFASSKETYEKYLTPTKQQEEIDFPPTLYLMGYAVAQCVSISLEEAQNFTDSLNQEINSHEFKTHAQASLLSHHLLHPHTSNISSLLNHCIKDSLVRKTDQNYQPLGLTTCDVAFAIQTKDTKELFQKMCSLREQLSSFINPSFNKDWNKTFLTWKDMQQSGAGLWLKHEETIWKLASDDLPKMTYKSLEESERHPDAVALWYIATNRLSILQSLYRVHKQPKVVEFLNHDFSDQRWRDAASKNAYTLLKQKRFSLGASFFLLGEAFEEALNICYRQLNDPQLALFLCRVMMIRFKNDANKYSLFSKYFRNITLTELLPMSVKFHDEWLQSALLWLNDYYVDAIVAMLPEKLRPSLHMSESGQISYTILTSVYFSNVFMRPDHQWYFSKGTTVGPVETVRDCLVYPLLFPKQTFFASLYRRYLFKNLDVRRRLLTVKQSLVEATLHDLSRSWTNLNNSQSSSCAKVENSLMLSKSEHVTPEIICFVVEAMEPFILQVEFIDQIFQLVKNLRYPFFNDAKFPVSFHWINMSSFYRMTYDSIYLTNQDIWSGTSSMLKSCSSDAHVVLTHHPFMTYPMSWCVNHGPHYFIHWLDKTFLHIFNNRNPIKEDTPQTTFPPSNLHKMQTETALRSSIPSIPCDLHTSLNDYLKRNPRLDLMFTFKNVSSKNCVSCIFGWTNSLFSLISELFSLQFHEGIFRFISNPITQHASPSYALLCCSFLSVAWFHTVKNSVPFHAITRFLALLTTSLNVLASTFLLLPSTTESSPRNTAHNETIGQEKKHTNSSTGNETWTDLHALLEVVNDFSRLCGQNDSTFTETSHHLLASITCLLRSNQTYFHQHTSHNLHPGFSKSLASHDVNVSPRRIQLWNGLRDMLLMLLFDNVLGVLEKTVELGEACFPTCFQSTKYALVDVNNNTSQPLFSECQDTLQSLFDVFKCLVRSFHNVFLCEYRVSKMTQFILFFTLEFPSFIPRMWPTLTSPCLSLTQGPSSKDVSDNASEHCWSTLFSETAVLSSQEISSFSSLWSSLQCSPKLILSLCREPMHYLPDIFTALLHSSLTHIPINQRVCQIRDAPFSFTVDSTQPLSCLYHVPILSGNSLSLCNGVPVGLSANITILSQKSSCNTLFIATRKKNTLLHLPRAIYDEYINSTDTHTSEHHIFPTQQPRVPASIDLLSHNSTSLATHEKQLYSKGTSQKQYTTCLPNGKMKMQCNGITNLTLPLYEQQLANWISHSSTLCYEKKVCSPINTEDSRTASVTALSSNPTQAPQKTQAELSNTKLTNQLKQGVKKHHKNAKQLIFHTKDTCSTKSTDYPVSLVCAEDSQLGDHYGKKSSAAQKYLPSPIVFLPFEMFLCGMQTSATNLLNKNMDLDAEDFLSFSNIFINSNLTSYLSNLSEGDDLKKNYILQYIMSQRQNINTHASYLYLTFLNNILSKFYFKIFKKLETNFLQSSFSPYLKKKSNANFHVSLLINHPFLPIAAGAILLSLKESITHFSTDIIPIIGLWSFYSGEIIGTFSLSTVSPRFFSAPSGKAKTNEFHTIQSNSEERVIQIHSNHKQRPHTVFHPFFSKFDTTHNILNTTQLPTYQQAGHIVSLQWSSCGNYLIAAHIKGWVTLWSFIDSNNLITTNATPMNSTTQALCSDTAKHPSSVINDSSFFSIGIKIHNTVCRYATLLKNNSTCGDILITSGRGLHNSIVLENKIILSQKREFNDGSSHGSEQNLVCVWDWQLDHLKKKSSHSLPKLRLIDNNFYRSDEPTCFVIWYARHLIIYGTKLGGVRYLNLRPCSKVSDWIIPCSPVIHPTDENEKTSLATRHDTGLSSKSILKIFLLESTHRLITCYTDATIGIWNIDPLCSFYFSITGSLPQLQAQGKSFITQLKLLNTSTFKVSLKLSKKMNTQSSHENFKSSHLAGKIGTVLARGIHGSRHTLIDAHMVVKHHILTLTDDGSIMLTRLL